MGSTLLEILLVPGIIAFLFVVPSVWWHISYSLARRKIIRLWDEGCTESLAIYTFPFPHVVVRSTSTPEEQHIYRTRSMDTWVEEDGSVRSIPVFGISNEVFQ